MKMKNIKTTLLAVYTVSLVMLFQNCSNTAMQFNSGATALSSSYGADESFLTNEDTALYAKPVQTLTLTNGAVSTFAMTSQA
ncbi:MAG: hypothetical protein H7326_10295, partial [Bdellovibrionaceae bacterium]|nr:hypothetical protein [Pseudobdellovibrionaceae bacterium]